MAEPGSARSATCNAAAKVPPDEIPQKMPSSIANARAEMNFAGGGELGQLNWSEYSGCTTTLEATSDEDGRFSLTPLPPVLDAVNGDTFIPEYRVVANGTATPVLLMSSWSTERG